MDVSTRFGKQPQEYNNRTCIVVVEIRDTSVGLIVDKVAEVLAIADENIVPANANKVLQNKYIKSIGKSESGVILILECDKLLNDDILYRTY